MQYWASSHADRRKRHLTLLKEELTQVYEPIVKVLNQYLDPIHLDYDGIDEQGISAIRTIANKSLIYADELHNLVLEAIAAHKRRGYGDYDEDRRLAIYVDKRYRWLRRHLGYPYSRRVAQPRWLRNLKRQYYRCQLNWQRWNEQRRH